jgi:hypothetical protein
MAMTPTSLKEISARVVKTSLITFGPGDLPRTVIDYLSSANCCVNPKCQGEDLCLVSALLYLGRQIIDLFTIKTTPTFSHCQRENLTNVSSAFPLIKTLNDLTFETFQLNRRDKRM